MTTKYRPVDTRVLNDMDTAPESAKAYHDANAATEAQKLAERYKDSPAYLMLLSKHISGVADKAYSKHMQELQASKPKRDQFISQGVWDNE